MEGDRVRTRRWSYLLQLMPTPFRWAGMEFIRIARWLDQSAARAVELFRASPAWFFVSTVGLVSIGLTFVLFVSMVSPQSRKLLAEQEQPKSPKVSGREHLEKLNDWSVQDKWRIAHLFVPNQPVHHPKNIRIDSRLAATTAADDKPTRFSPRSRIANRGASARDIDVRLDLARPKIATQGYRTVDGLTTDSETTSKLKRVSHQILLRKPRALVQATWEFGSQCLPSYSGLPVRRPKPVPEPVIPAEPTIPLEPRRSGAPDISFDMELIRHTRVAGLFPPGSHLVSLSKRSEYPPGSLQFEIGLSSYNDSDWFRFNTSPQKRPPELIPYSGIGLVDPRHQEMNFSDDDTASLPASAEVELRVEWVTPDTVSAGHIQKSQLHISNEGHHPVPRIEIEDVIPRSETVISATPDGQVVASEDAHKAEKQLHREIRGLSPGEGHSFDLRWITKAERRYIQRTRIVTHAAVAALTEVSRSEEPATPEPPAPEPQVSTPVEPEPQPEVPTPVEKPPKRHPAFACDFRYLDRAYVGDQIDLEIAVRNTGDVDLHDVKVRLELPAQFSHQNGKELTFDAGMIPVSGRNQTVMKVSAVSTGQAVHVVKVATTEKVHARGEAHIEVVERAKSVPAVPPTIPAKPATTAPTPNPVMSPCYCNQVSMNDGFEFFSIP